MEIKPSSYKKYTYKFFYFLMSFGILFSLEPSIAGLKDKYSTQRGCTVSNSQYMAINHIEREIYYCVINNEVYRANDGKPGSSYWAGRKGSIGKQETDKYGTYEFAIEGNNLVKYSCEDFYGCSGKVKRQIWATER